ncbi:MAG TPA: AMP-binding protein, partial [Blastocatellia bacterium]|nr:AMP-binding protein [Blastocatellia bacterium]
MISELSQKGFKLDSEMIDLSRHQSLGSALREAVDKFAGETCLIEADRERENHRLTYREFKEAAIPMAKFLQDRGFKAGSRAAIIMTNQSCWPIAAYAVFYAGGVLVPLDYKLSAPEQMALLAHSKAEVLVTEYHLWRAITESEPGSAPGAAATGSTSDRSLPLPALGRLRTVVVTGAPKNADLRGAIRWEDPEVKGEPVFVPRKRTDWACVVYSSGTGGRPKGCVLTHENYLEQCVSLTSLYPFWPGVRYLSILPTNHAIDFMVGFIGPFVCGATVVHLRTLRPEFVREAFTRYKITYVALAPLILKNLQAGLRKRFDELPPLKRFVFDRLVEVNRALTQKEPRLELSRMLLKQVHNAFGGELRAIFAGGAFCDPQMIQFFYDLGIQVAIGYGLTEAGTAITLNDFNPFRADTVGKPLPGMEVKIVNPDDDGIGQVATRSKAVMSHYLDDPELTAETIVDGWLMTGDLGRFDSMGHLQLFGRVKNMIVTEEGKNVYPEDIERAFDGLPVKEFCVFAANYIWPERSMLGEKLIIVLRLHEGQELTGELIRDLWRRNNTLLNFKRVSGYTLWDC